MTARLVDVALRAREPRVVADFWARALGWRVGDASEDAVVLVPTDATTFGIVVQRSEQPKVGQNRIHVDLTTSSVDDQRDSVADLLAHGGSHVDIGQGPDETHVVFADPEGNELCIIGPHNRFLASCPRLGAVNCDGTYELGHFWSAALGWPLVWDHEEETAIQAPDGTGPKITWSGTPLMPKPPVERMHFHVVADGIDEVLALGATRSDRPACPGAIALDDVDGNAFCVHPVSESG